MASRNVPPSMMLLLGRLPRAHRGVSGKKSPSWRNHKPPWVPQEGGRWGLFSCMTWPPVSLQAEFWLVQAVLNGACSPNKTKDRHLDMKLWATPWLCSCPRVDTGITYTKAGWTLLPALPMLPWGNPGHLLYCPQPKRTLQGCKDREGRHISMR